MVDTVQTCKDCTEDKPISEFYYNRKGKSYAKHCKKCNHKRVEIWRKASPDKNIRTKRKYKIKAKYGISIDDYNAMFLEQNGCCIICGLHQSQLPQTLGVDHNHITGEVRGLLCRRCNVGIGFFDDDTARMTKAVKYLNSGAIMVNEYM